MNQPKHTPEQYELCKDIAALETIIAYSGNSIPYEYAVRINQVKEAMQAKLQEINLKVSPADLFEHIAAKYLPKH